MKKYYLKNICLEYVRLKMESPKNITMNISEVPPDRSANLYEFMSKYGTVKTGPRAGDRTNTSIRSGSWYIPKNRVDEFLDLYHEHTIVKGTIDKFAYMTEVPMDMSCIKVDIDMRWMSDELERRYNLDNIMSILQVYYDVLREIVNFVKDDEFHAFVFEKSKPSRTGKRDGENKDGLHIMWPFLNVEEDVELLVRERVIDRFSREGTFDDLELSNSISDLIDKAVCRRRQCWQMYGSRKPDCEAYELTHIFTIDPDEDEITEIPTNTYTSRKLLDILSIRVGHDESSPKTLIKTAAKKLLESRKPSAPVTIRAKKQLYRSPSRMSKTIRINDGKKDSLGRREKEQLKDISERVMGLSDSRVREYKDWHKLGQLLFNVHNADDTLLNTWIKKSECITKYKRTAAAACKKEWTEKFPKWVQERPPGIGTLNMWLEVDNPKVFQSLNQKSIYGLITESIKNEVLDYDVAKVLHAMYDGLFMHVGGTKGGSWYEYSEIEHRWKILRDSTNLRSKISTSLYNTYSSFMKEAMNKSKVLGDFWDEKRAATGKVMNKLKRTGFKSNLMKEATELFNDSKDIFYTKLDSSTKLLGFTNGVYDLESSEFREGRPEDYISFTTGIDYLPYDESDPEFMYYVSFLHKVIDYMFPNDCAVCKAKHEKCGLKDYILLLLSTFLDGSTKDEQFHIWIGSGANGKSLLVELFQDALGDYAGILDNTVITTKRTKSGNATPELFDTKNKRFIVIQETEKSAQIQAGLLKQLTGGDKITARGLYKDIETFKPQFKMVLVTNNLPKLPPKDGGVWRRVRATNFRSKFLDDPKGHWVDEDNNIISKEEHERKVDKGDELSDTWIPDKNEYPKDKTLKDKFKDEGSGKIYKEVFISMLINIYNRYKKKELTLIEPACVMEATRKYQMDQDKIKQFIAEKIIRTEKPNAKGVLIGEVWLAYKDWHADNCQGERIIAKKSLQDDFIKEFGDYKNASKTRRLQRGWFNIRLRKESALDTDDEDDFDDCSLDSLEV